MKRARNRRGGHGQNIDGLPQAFEPFLVLDAEALLLVDNDQSQVLEMHVGAYNAVGADDDVDAALPQPLDNLFLLAAGAKSADAFHDEWVLGEPLAEGAEVLL